MRKNREKQAPAERDWGPIRVSKKHLAIVSRLAKESRKTQRAVAEECLELAWKMRRISGPNTITPEIPQ